MESPDEIPVHLERLGIQELPVQTQLYFLDRLLGATLGLVGYSIVHVINAATLLLTFLIAWPIGDLIFESSLRYRTLRRENSIIAASLYTLASTPGLFVSALPYNLLMFTKTVLGLVINLALTAFVAPYLGFTRGTMKIVDMMRKPLEIFAILNDITVAVLSVHRFFWLALDKTPDYQRLLEALANVKHLMERSDLPIIETLAIKLLMDFVSMFTIIAKLEQNPNITPESLNKVKLAITFCETIQKEILINYYKTAKEIPHGKASINTLNAGTMGLHISLQNQIETLLLEQHQYLQELKEILNEAPLNETRLNQTYNRMLNETKKFPKDTLPEVQKIFSGARSKALEAEKIDQNMQNLVASFLNVDALFATLRTDMYKALVKSNKEQMTAEYFDETFALSPESLRSIRHTKLSETDRALCDEAAKTNPTVRNLFSQYKELESHLNRDCPILMGKPTSKSKIVLVKQYCSNNQTAVDNPGDIWLPISGYSENTIHDRDELKTYCTYSNPLRRKITHVSSGDSFFSPSKGDNTVANTHQYKTRYRYHDYYQNKENPNENEIYSQALQSLAQELSKHVNLPDFNPKLRAQSTNERASNSSCISLQNYTSIFKKVDSNKAPLTARLPSMVATNNSSNLQESADMKRADVNEVPQSINP